MLSSPLGVIVPEVVYVWLNETYIGLCLCLHLLIQGHSDHSHRWSVVIRSTGRNHASSKHSDVYHLIHTLGYKIILSTYILNDRWRKKYEILCRTQHLYEPVYVLVVSKE